MIRIVKNYDIITDLVGHVVVLLLELFEQQFVTLLVLVEFLVRELEVNLVCQP
jgi:hypothetical protein